MTCDLCGSRGSSVLFEAYDRRFGTPGRFAIVECTTCRLVRTEPSPSDLASVYPDRYYTHVMPRKPTRRVRSRVLRAYGLATDGHELLSALDGVLADRLLPGLPPGPPGRLLDVGCGSGQMLLALQVAGWDGHGIEIDGHAVAAARAAGLANVRTGDLLEADYAPESFDAVRFWHSLEHLRSPRAHLLAAHRVLRRGGSLTIGVPNVRSLLSRMFRDRSFYLDVPRHLWHFDRATLVQLVSACGFRVLHVRLATGSQPLLGTLALVRGKENSRTSRAAWYGLLPVAMLLDRMGLGDALELRAVRAEGRD